MSTNEPTVPGGDADADLSRNNDGYSEVFGAVVAAVDEARFAFLTTKQRDGRLVTRPLAVQEAPFDGTMWFFVERDSDKVSELEVDSEVNVAVQTKGSWVSIAGSASIQTDRAKIDELWNPFAEAWFEGGREDPKVTLLRVEAESAEIWTSDDSGPVRGFKTVKAMLKKERPNIGENESIEINSSPNGS